MNALCRQGNETVLELFTVLSVQDVERAMSRKQKKANKKAAKYAASFILTSTTTTSSIEVLFFIDLHVLNLMVINKLVGLRASCSSTPTLVAGSRNP